ncbi:MAG: ethanolamine utilization protein EutQ [Thalassolituus oleivorans]|jgi:ethanolamine utilization protein EutQ
MKTLITAEYVKKLNRDGEVSLTMTPQSTIITPEARDVAKSLGIQIIDAAVNVAAKPVAHYTATNAAISTTALASRNTDDTDPAQAIRRAVEAKLPVGKHDSALLEQLVAKAIRELQGTESGPYCERQVSDNGIVLVRGGSVKFGRFDGAPDQQIGLTDVIGSGDKSPIAAGFMQWEKSSFPWTLNYDEIEVILEGELHITCGGKTSIGKPGDVMFVPKGSSIEFGTPTKVRFVYITYPANWAD